MELFGHIKNLQILEIRSSTKEYSAYRKLANLLKKNNKIQYLRIADCRTSNDAKHVIDALGNENCKVTHLLLAYNSITTERAKNLRDALKIGENCKLTESNPNNNKLTDVGVQYLREALASGESKLSKLFLSGNKLSDTAAKYLHDVLKSGNCKLTELNLNNNNLQLPTYCIIPK